MKLTVRDRETKDVDTDWRRAAILTLIFNFSAGGGGTAFPSGYLLAALVILCLCNCMTDVAVWRYCCGCLHMGFHYFWFVFPHNPSLTANPREQLTPMHRCLLVYTVGTSCLGNHWQAALSKVNLQHKKRRNIYVFIYINYTIRTILQTTLTAGFE